jgi:isoaspartyl peptidase/L-asparaginase-like protein (Ntn-hydrolase superfamily)
MKSSEPTLRAIRAQVQFELAQAAAEVAQAAAITASVQQQVNLAAGRYESVARELQAIMGSSRINPPQLAAMQRMFHSEHVLLQGYQKELAAAEQREHQARSVLASLRNRERSLERALQAEQHRRKLKELAQDMLVADDMWLQQPRGELP